MSKKFWGYLFIFPENVYVKYVNILFQKSFFTEDIYKEKIKNFALHYMVCPYNQIYLKNYRSTSQNYKMAQHNILI